MCSRTVSTTMTELWMQKIWYHKTVLQIHRSNALEIYLIFDIVTWENKTSIVFNVLVNHITLIRCSRTWWNYERRKYDTTKQFFKFTEKYVFCNSQREKIKRSWTQCLNVVSIMMNEISRKIQINLVFTCSTITDILKKCKVFSTHFVRFRRMKYICEKKIFNEKCQFIQCIWIFSFGKMFCFALLHPSVITNDTSTRTAGSRNSALMLVFRIKCTWSR